PLLPAPRLSPPGAVLPFSSRSAPPPYPPPSPRPPPSPLAPCTLSARAVHPVSSPESDRAEHPICSPRKRRSSAILAPANVLPRSDHRQKVQSPLDDRQRRLRNGLSRGRHLDSQEGRSQGSTQAGCRLPRAPARTATAGRAESSKHRHDPDGRE